jgi:Tol biopolymer transport system component
MALPAGTRLGPYELLGPDAARGQTNVYRARDRRLDRSVAIRVLPRAGVEDPSSQARTEAVAALQHPHICGVHAVGEQDGIHFLVLESLEGEALPARLKRGALSRSEALDYATQIADALDHAHRHGLTHGALRPASVILTPAGAKLLDLGIAAGSPADGATIESAGSLPVEKLAYLSPERIASGTIDVRTDVFALGAILYEMLTGRRAFEGTTPAEVVDAICHHDAAPLRAQGSGQPNLALVERAVRKCLAKDPDRRWQSCGDLADELRWIAGVVHPPRPSSPRARPVRLGRLAAAASAAIIGAAAGWILSRGPAARAEPISFTLPIPDDVSLVRSGPGADAGVELAVSPDGQHVAFVATRGGRTQIWVQSLSSLAPRVLERTDDAAFPFWSPDSRQIAFFSSGKLKRTSITADGSQAADILCDAQAARGGTWSRDDVIVFAPSTNGPLYRIPAAGGQPVPVTTLKTDEQEVGHYWPQFLEDGRRVLFLVARSDGPATLAIGSRDGGPWTRVQDAESNATYADGHLLFYRNGSLRAQPFDIDRVRATGSAFPVAKFSARSLLFYASFSVSPAGVLSFGAPGPRLTSRLLWTDRAGRQVGQIGDAGTMHLNIALSPDGRRIAAAVHGPQGDADLRIIDVATGVWSRFTFDQFEDSTPVWSPDGRQVVFSSARRGSEDLYVRDAGGTRGELPLLVAPEHQFATDWSPDGKYVLYEQLAPATGFDLWLLPTFGDRKPIPFDTSPGMQTQARFSPDGRWVAYAAEVDGRWDVYVQPFPPTGGRTQISRSRGIMPMWRPDGRELFYLDAGARLMAVPIENGRPPASAQPVGLFDTHINPNAGRNQYIVNHDGTRFLVNASGSWPPLPAPGVIVNWRAAVER